MAGGKIFNGGGGSGSGSGSDGSVSPLLLQNQASEPLNNLLISGSSSSSSPSFMGPRSMVNFKDGGRRSGSNRLMFCPFDDKENGEDEMDEFLHQPEKKRRLMADQVQFLEKSFEQENKLVSDRKTQLAKEIGLQPRQVAIWFQNRRGRWKTKQPLRKRGEDSTAKEEGNEAADERLGRGVKSNGRRNGVNFTGCNLS